MSISGLVVTLSDDRLADAALAALIADPRLTLGKQFGRRLAIVADTPGVETDRQLFDHLRTMPGITNVDVTYVHLDAGPSQSGGPGSHATAEAHHAHP